VNGGAPLDLQQIASAGHRYEVSIANESAEDGAARREQDALEAALDRRLRFLGFVFAMLGLGVIFAGCVYLFSAGGADDKKWAAAVVSAIVSGFSGYLLGQSRR